MPSMRHGRSCEINMCIQTPTSTTLGTTPTTIVKMVTTCHSMAESHPAHGNNKSHTVYNLPSCCDQLVCTEQSLKTQRRRRTLSMQPFPHKVVRCSPTKHVVVYYPHACKKTAWDDCGSITEHTQHGEEHVCTPCICGCGCQRA